MNKRQIANEVLECLAHDYGVIFTDGEDLIFAYKVMLLLDFLEEEVCQTRNVFRQLQFVSPN